MPKAYTSPGLVKRQSLKISGAVYMMQHIAQLEVSMDDAKAVYVVHAFGYLLRRPQQCPLQSEIGTGIASKVLETMLTSLSKSDSDTLREGSSRRKPRVPPL
ncbi:MAG: hypothetical protein FRX49_07262 [Trebouxia sp. A1-2]|nr:MAG: hypothetical protein FRX49_07262 [Trebouxia sp. A1-2]